MILRHHSLDSSLPLDHVDTRPRQTVILKSNNKPRHAHAVINSKTLTLVPPFPRHDWLNENVALRTFLFANPLQPSYPNCLNGFVLLVIIAPHYTSAPPSHLHCTSAPQYANQLHHNMQIYTAPQFTSAPQFAPHCSSHLFAPLWGGVVTPTLLLPGQV